MSKGTSQVISFDVYPTTASCSVSRDGDGQLGVVSKGSNSIQVRKARADIAVVCSAPGYEPKKQWVESAADNTALAGIALDGGLTDMITGAMWVYPEKVQLRLVKLNSDSIVPGSPMLGTSGEPAKQQNSERVSSQSLGVASAAKESNERPFVASHQAPITAVSDSQSASGIREGISASQSLSNPSPQVSNSVLGSPSPSSAPSLTSHSAQPTRSKEQAVFPRSSRRALVIGNNEYKSIPRLDNAVGDADSFARVLASFGYQVTHHKDLTERNFKKALRDFNAQLQGGDEVVFFYAGHGVQLDGQNFLLPTDVGSSTAEQVRDESVPLQRVLDDFNRQRARFTLAVVDACRDNPFSGGTRSSVSRGMAPTSAATGQIIIFSAGVGQQALDRLGANDREPNGLFTRVFLKKVSESDSTIDRVIREVRREVAERAKKVGHEQVPAIYDQAIGDFYFKNRVN